MKLMRWFMISAIVLQVAVGASVSQATTSEPSNSPASGGQPSAASPSASPSVAGSTRGETTSAQGNWPLPPVYPDYPNGQRGEDFTRVERLVELTRGPFAGVHWDPEAQQIVLSVTNSGLTLARGLREGYAREGRTTPLAFRTVRFSNADLESLHTRVVDATYSWLGDESKHVTGSAIRPEMNGIVVDVDVPLEQKMQQITSDRWGEDVRLQFRPGSKLTEQGSPDADTPPFYGSIKWTVSNFCTAAFPGKVTNTAGQVFNGLLTAGHCSLGNTTGYHNGYSFNLANRAYQTSSNGGAQSDAMVLRTSNGESTGSNIYISASGSQIRGVGGYATSSGAVNATYNRSMTRPFANQEWGKSFEIKDAVRLVDKTQICKANNSGGTTCGIWKYWTALDSCDEPYPPTAPGDSGAPIYTLMAGGKANALGHHIGISDETYYDGLLCHRVMYMIPIFNAMSVSRFTPNTN